MLPQRQQHCPALHDGSMASHGRLEQSLLPAMASARFRTVRRHSVGWGAGLLVLVVALPGVGAAQVAVPQIPRDDWKDCAYNDQTIRCRDTQSDDRFVILWIDGLRSSFRRRPPARPDLPVYWTDRYGGLWRRELYPQGNTLLTNLGTGNRILVPLRFPCKPPLKGEVGYCRP